MTESTVGYLFAIDDTLPHNRGRKIVLGATLAEKSATVLGECGLHASIDPFDALLEARGPLLYRVRLSGEVVHNRNKCVASE